MFSVTYISFPGAIHISYVETKSTHQSQFKRWWQVESRPLDATGLLMICLQSMWGVHDSLTTEWYIKEEEEYLKYLNMLLEKNELWCNFFQIKLCS